MNNIDGYTIKNIFSDDDLTDEELTCKMESCDVFVPIFGTIKLNEALQVLEKALPNMKPLWIHVHHRDNQISIGAIYK
jgi:hypothetical protein